MATTVDPVHVKEEGQHQEVNNPGQDGVLDCHDVRIPGEELLGGDDNPVRDQEGDNDFRGSQDIVNKVVVGNFDHDVVQGGNQRANATESNQ